MYTVRSAGTKGIGVFAAKHISPGFRILAERPLCTVKSEKHAYAAVRRILASDNDRAWLNDLTTSGRQRNSLLDKLTATWHLARSGIMPSLQTVNEYNAVLPKFRNNNFDIGGGNQAMFREISRLNHSCLPNSQGNFNERIGTFTIHALKSIAPDEEITISYLDSHLATAESRRGELQERYGFECNCLLCNLSSSIAQKRDEKRQILLEKIKRNAEMESLSGKGSPKAELELLNDMIEIFVEEEVRGRELATMFLSAAEMHWRLGNEADFLQFVELGLTTERGCLGEDNPLYREDVNRMERFHNVREPE